MERLRFFCPERRRKRIEILIIDYSFKVGY